MTATEFDCQAHHNDLSVYNNGTTVLCGKERLGRLAETSLEDMWQSQAAQEFRRQVDVDRAPCMTCDYRQRCLSPSMSLLANHFNERIAKALTPDTQQAIAFGRAISDNESIERFVRDISKRFAVFDIASVGNRVTARRVYSVNERGPLIEAPTTHELQTLMASEVEAPVHPRLIEQGYHSYNLVGYDGLFWALPQSLGFVNLTQDGDRKRPGVLWAATLDELRLSIYSDDAAIQFETAKKTAATATARLQSIANGSSAER